MTINRNSRVPFYYQLYEILRDKITHGEWKPGDLLPTETELLEQYAVSRSTVRQALDMLVSNGQIFRQRGKGSFVAHPTVEQGLSRIISFTEDMRQRGLESFTKVLSANLVSASEDIAGRLQIEPGVELAHLERLRLADNEPMSIENAYLIHKHCPGVLKHDYATTSLRETLFRQYNIRLVYAKQTIQAVSAPRKLAEKLEVKTNAPLLYIERISFSDADIPLEYIQFHHRGDRYKLYNELRD